MTFKQWVESVVDPLLIYRSEPYMQVMRLAWNASRAEALKERDHRSEAEMRTKSGPLHPSVRVLCKLGSVIVHLSELVSPDGHPFDQIVFKNLMDDPELLEWLSQMDKLALLPSKRR